MSGISQEYKVLSIPERLDLALSATLEARWRPYLVRDQHSQVKIYFSRRLDLAPDEVEILLADADQTVRLSCAKREDLSPEQVERCVRDRDPNIRYCIARNVLLTETQRERLLQDSDELVARAARKGPKIRATRRRPGQAELIR